MNTYIKYIISLINFVFVFYIIYTINEFGFTSGFRRDYYPLVIPSDYLYIFFIGLIFLFSLITSLLLRRDNKCLNGGLIISTISVIMGILAILMRGGDIALIPYGIGFILFTIGTLFVYLSIIWK